MAAVCALATTLTHLVLHFVLPSLSASWDETLVRGEWFALASEAAVYAGVNRPRDIGRALVASALANAASFVAGMLVLR
jgi:hypothetical protein